MSPPASNMSTVVETMCGLSHPLRQISSHLLSQLSNQVCKSSIKSSTKPNIELPQYVADSTNTFGPHEDTLVSACETFGDLQ